MDGAVRAARPDRGRKRFLAGVLAGLVLPLLGGEVYVRLKPPADFEPYLEDRSSHAGIYKPDPRLGVDYRSAAAYVPREAPRLADLRPLNTAQPTWLFFGNSFARRLSASARAALPEHRVLFFRESNDEFHMRVAQARLVLESGLRAERMFFTLIPVEFARYVLRPLSWVYVKQDGTIGSRFRMPGWPLDGLLTHSWLARIAWIRSQLHHADPAFRMSDITGKVPKSVLEDFKLMFGVLAEVSRRHAVAASVVLLPDRRQILGNPDFTLQNEIAALAKAAGLGVLDPRDTFLGYKDRSAIYLPDWHYSPIGDRLLLDALAVHLNLPIPVAPRRRAVLP